MAYFPTHLLDLAPECRSGIQSDAGINEAFHPKDNDGCLYAGSGASQTRSTSSGSGIVLPGDQHGR